MPILDRALLNKTMNQKITVKYSAAGQIGEYGSDREIIELSVSIDSFDDYPATLELLRERVLENLNLKEKHDKLSDEYNELAHKFLKVTKQLESAYKQWEIVSNFMKTQGLKSDTAEFPKEALTNLSKSLPTTESGYPD